MDCFDEIDEPTTLFYEDQPVLYIEEKFNGKQFKTDMRAFIVYDNTDKFFYVYGSRKCKRNKKYINYMLKYERLDLLFNYLNVAMNIREHKVNVTGYFLSGLTSEDTFDDFADKTSNYNQLFGYDNVILNRKGFCKYLQTLNTDSE
jgi:hypothetical protein